MGKEFLGSGGSRTVYDNEDGYVLKTPNHESDMWANEREIEVYKIFKKNNIEYLLGEVDLINSTKETLYMKKIVSFNPSNISGNYDIRDNKEKVLKEKLENNSEWNSDFINFSIFCGEVADSEEGKKLKKLGYYIYPDLFEEYIELYKVFNSYGKDFLLFLEIVDKYNLGLDFHIGGIHMDNVGYDENYNIQIFDYGG